MEQKYLRIYEQLLDHYGPQHWWPADTPFEMMISAILVQSTNWRNVEKAMARLKLYLDPRVMEKLTTDELAELIRPSGFYTIKAKRIQAFLAWFKNYNYDISKVKQLDAKQRRNELLNIYGLGPETVDCMLVYAFDVPVFIVDAYARRIFERLGYQMPSKYDDFRMIVEQELPRDLKLYNEYHALLVQHAKVHCKAKPICDGCPLINQCEYTKGIVTSKALGYNS